MPVGGACRPPGVVGAVTAAETPRRLRDLPHADVLSRKVPVAVSLPSRLLGLAFLRPGRAGVGLLIPRCRSVHTFGMRFALDVVFLDDDLRPLSVRRGLRPSRLAADRRARAVLELPEGCAG